MTLEGFRPQKQKNPLQERAFWSLSDRTGLAIGAEGETRTPTPSRAHEPESCVSTRFHHFGEGDDIYVSCNQLV